MGRPIYLVTAAARSLAERIADHLGLFSGVFASDPRRNLSAAAKAHALVERFGHATFDYAGNSNADLFVWRVARFSILVNVSRSFVKRAEAGIRITQVFPKKSGFRAYLRSIRVHQWMKNTLIFVPLVAAQRFDELPLVLTAAVSFLSFSFCASSMYVLNDLLDLDADRRHSWKHSRPFASGEIPIQQGILLIPALLLAGIALALMISQTFVLLLFAYTATTLLYSMYLKSLPLLDVMALALLYTLRVLAGGNLLHIPISFWLLAFSTFLFLSLALSKRYAEILNLQSAGAGRPIGRGYSSGDLECLRTMGIAGAYAAVLVLAFYVNSPEVMKLYRSPNVLWVLCTMVLYWSNWIWMKASRGESTIWSSHSVTEPVT